MHLDRSTGGTAGRLGPGIAARVACDLAVGGPT